MKATRLYAHVLVDVLSAPDAKYSFDSITRELKSFAQLNKADPLMLKVFDNPTISDDDKQKALHAFVQKLDASKFTEKFISLLVKRNRMKYLENILLEVESIQAEKAGGLIGEIVSALPLDAETVSGVAQALSKKLNKTVRLKERVDSSLIAGLRVTVGGKTYDGSVRAKLNQIKEKFN